MRFITLPFIVLSVVINIYRTSAQSILKPSIGVFAAPGDKDSICPMVFNIDTAYRYESTGLYEGDTIPEFVLYTVKDERISISEVLKSGKPVLLIGGSYTCPVFRQKRERINQLQATYGERVNIFVVYTQEAHPEGPDLSPNSGTVWTLDANIKKNILYPQPRTYGDRRKAAMDMLASRELHVPLLLDGPCNPWWTTFGVAPNSAFLISPNGTLICKQGWLNGGLPMSVYIDSVLAAMNNSEIKQADNKVEIKQSADSIQFLLLKEVANAGITIYDPYGRDPYGTVAFSGKEYAMDATRFSAGEFVYEIRNDEAVIIGKFLISKSKKERADAGGTR